jgi:hypothetical protein
MGAIRVNHRLGLGEEKLRGLDPVLEENRPGIDCAYFDVCGWEYGAQ